MTLLLQALGALTVAAAIYQIGLAVALASKRATQQKEQRRLTLVLLKERVQTARKVRQLGEALQSLSWSGYRKFVVVRKVYEDASDAAPAVWRRETPAGSIRQEGDARAALEALYRGRPAVALEPDDLDAWDQAFAVEFGEAARTRLHNVCSFYLAPHDGKPLPPFLPGQYLTFQLRIPGIDKPTIRCYSLSDCAHPDYYRVTIKRMPPPRHRANRPLGLSSSFFHDQVREGDILDIQAPRGGFRLDLAKEERPIVLIGGGIGITPLLSMLNAVATSGGKPETWFFYGVRNKSEQVMKGHLERVARENDNVRLHVCYSEPAASDERGRDYQHSERVSVDLMRRMLPSNNYDFYICGPPPMMNQITKDLLGWGVPEARIHYEAFGAATVKKVAHQTDEGAAPSGPLFKVTFARSGKDFVWDPKASSLLEFAERQGIRIDSGCRAGNCGTCVTAVRSGEFSCRIAPGARAGPGTCLACISIPKADLVLDA